MHTLLSLPPNVVKHFHSLTSLDRAEWFCTSDPVGCKLGSGGGTTWLLQQCKLQEDASASFSEWLGREKRILLHAGGQSRRLPCYAPSGKILTPIPVFRWESGQCIDQTLLDIQMPLYNCIMDKAPSSLRTLIASGDVYLRATEPLQEIPDADVVCYGLWADPTLASHHGVFMIDRQCANSLDFMLQKPTVEEQARLIRSHYCLMDIGVWLLSDRAVELLVKHSTDSEGNVINYDLYSDFGYALGNNPKHYDAEISQLKVAILPLPGGEFYHFGTAPELLSSSMDIQNLVKDQRYIIQQNVKRHPSLFVQNVAMQIGFNENNQYIWIENSFIGKNWRFTDHNIITGVPENDWLIEMPSGLCIDVIPYTEKGFVLRPYGYNDAFRGAFDSEATTYLGKSWKTWAETHGLEAADFGCTDDIQSAKLFPIFEDIEEMGKWFVWMTSNQPDLKLAEAWKTLARLSADDISNDANLPRLFEQRRKLLNGNLLKLANNWQKSVFYQVNLKDVAQKYADSHLALPFPLPESAPLMARIHDAMFRAEKLYIENDSNAETMERRAFELLSQGLTDGILDHKCSPKLDICEDQIVWSRSPVRIDIAGGWTDTPPYSLTKGGNVINFAIEMNGQQPLQVYVKPCKEPVVICRSIDIGAIERIETYDELKMFNKIGSPFSIPKAALALSGFLSPFGAATYPSLRAQLEDFGCGIEITLLSAIPAGSGLGTSSILAATVLGALSDFCGLGWDKNEICHRVLVLEQLLTTGGGWQDQYGGVLPGVKLLQTSPGFEQMPLTRWLPDTLFTAPEYKDCHLLYYTGLTRTAKKILAEIVRGMFLNSTRHLSLLQQMKDHTLEMYEAIQRIDMLAYGRLLRETWRQNKLLDSGTNPPLIDQLCDGIDDLTLGYKLPGAGGGGFLYMLAKSPEAAERIRTKLAEQPLGKNARFVDMSISQTGLQISRS